MKKISAAFSIGLIAILLISCNKYEEGPAISLRTKKERLSGFWKLESYMQNGQDVTATVQASFGTDCTWQIKKDGTYHISGNSNTDGTWLLEEKKTQISFSAGDTYEIVRLTNNELWIRYPGGDEGDLIKYKK